jgi:DNA-binding NtrC family response regulator
VWSAIGSDFFVPALSHSSSEGYETEATSSPRQALEIVKTNPCFDLLVTDVVMPEMCGPELAQKIARACPSTAVVLMSGCLLTANIPQKASFIPKPFSLKDLFAIVERTLERSRALRNSLNQAYEKAAELGAQSEEIGREVDKVWTRHRREHPPIEK